MDRPLADLGRARKCDHRNKTPRARIRHVAMPAAAHQGGWAAVMVAGFSMSGAPIAGSPGGDCRTLAGSATVGSVSITAMKRYPRPVTVWMKRGCSASSFRTCRILRTAPLMLLSVSTKTFLPQILSTICSRVTISPRSSTKNDRTSAGIRSSRSTRPERRN